MSLIGPLNPALIGALTADASVSRFRELLHCETRYIGLPPEAVTISANLYAPDGGIDAQVEAFDLLPEDTFLKAGRNGFQLKTGTSFKPWQRSSLKDELLSSSGGLDSEIRRTLEANGHYLLVCFGFDLTPEQRNSSRELIAELFSDAGFPRMVSKIDVFGQCQIATYFERYPSLRISLAGGSDDSFLSVLEWAQHAHMSNSVILSEEQSALVSHLRKQLQGEAKHIRVLGEPGIGKTRLVLEAVRIGTIAPIVLYVQHGAQFSHSALFRELLRDTPKHPLILILDELSEREMSEIWGHLKNRCGQLKLVTLDHGPSKGGDTEVDFITAPRLPDQTIKLILEGHVGKKYDLDRWVTICEGSPRVAQAVGENLAANPDDILKSPATVPIWDRFLFGYAHQQSDEARQIGLVMRHVALFSKFGFEDPVGSEAKYIALMVSGSDSTVSWPKFQEIVQSLRERRIIQGDRTLFIVPWALHIHLWREYWNYYGRGFDFAGVFETMPKSLHGWFMDMFRYAHGTSAAPVVRNILRQDGIYSNREFLASDKGTSFLSTLAEANPEATIALIERTIGTWSHEELYSFKENRQSVVWTLEKIAVWQPTFTRAARVLARLAIAENAENSNNSTGTLLGLFRIGSEWAATEASPQERLPAVLEMLRSDDDKMKRIGLKVAEASLNTTGGGFRIIGPENQGLKERAVLWVPKTYGEWWSGYKLFWKCLVGETRAWNDVLREDANSSILIAAEGQLRIEPFRDEVLSVIEKIVEDSATDIRRLNHFFIERRTWHSEEDALPVLQYLRRLEGQFTRRSLESRFQRYVLDTSWSEWVDHRVEDEDQEHTRPKKLVRALANRVAVNDSAFESLLPKFGEGNTESGALFSFGLAMCNSDEGYKRLEPLLANGDANNSQCLGGYLTGLRDCDPAKWQEVLIGLLKSKDTANRGANLIWQSGFDDQVLNACIDAFEADWIDSGPFRSLCCGMRWQSVSQDALIRLFDLLAGREDQLSAYVLVDLLDQILKEGRWPVGSEFVFKVASASAHFQDRLDTMHSYHWRHVCQKLIAHDPAKAMPLLDVILEFMGRNYRLSYDHDVEPIALSLCQIDPASSWKVVSNHLLSVTPKWRFDLFNWLHGGIGGFDGTMTVSPIAEFPLQLILDWIEECPEERAPMIAHCVPRSLDDEFGGALTRALISKYQAIDGVLSSISNIFHSEGWSGPRSQHYRKKRARFRKWLAVGFDARVDFWIENELIGLDAEIESAEISEEREGWNRP